MEPKCYGKIKKNYVGVWLHFLAFAIPDLQACDYFSDRNVSVITHNYIYEFTQREHFNHAAPTENHLHSCDLE